MKVFIYIIMSNSHKWIFFPNSILHQLLLNPFNILHFKNILYFLFNLPTVVVFTRELKTMARETIFTC